MRPARRSRTGDSEAALETLESAESRIDDLTAAGTTRLAAAGALLGVLIVALIVIARRTRQLAAQAGHPAAHDHAAGDHAADDQAADP